MTTERKKAILVIFITLMVGILIGALASGMFARHHYRGNRKGFDKEYFRNRGGFAEKIYKITQADSLQRRQMEPIVEQTMTSIDTLQQKTNSDVNRLLDSMIVSLRPILKSDQLNKLKTFSKNKNDYDRHHRRHH
jgi:hypothetical protein